MPKSGQDKKGPVPLGGKRDTGLDRRGSRPTVNACWRSWVSFFDGLGSVVGVHYVGVSILRPEVGGPRP